MPLSSTGLVEINATTLRVLKNGQLVDVLTLTASGSPDIPLGGLVIGHTAGLQAQLNAKATTAQLHATADSLAAEIDSVEAQVSALGDTLIAVGGAVSLKQDPIGDGSPSIEKTDGLQTRLNDIRDIQAAALASIGGASQQLVYTQQDLAALTSVVDTKASTAALSALSVIFNAVATSLNNQYSTVSSLLGTRASTASVTAALALNQDQIG